ncbi:MAG: hypothetical protein HYS22_00060 [Deltaproteobacteria bacterium]|nr:hypothetical protein [Deltaproteobacteria bacterium]
MKNSHPLHLAVLLLVSLELCLVSTAMAAQQTEQGPSLAAVINDMRMKQQAEERNSVVRVIQPMMTPQRDVCSPIQQARQRLRDLATKDKKSVGNLNVEAGHGEVKVDGNSGTVNNSVNVQVVNPNEKNCL